MSQSDQETSVVRINHEHNDWDYVESHETVGTHGVPTFNGVRDRQVFP